MKIYSPVKDTNGVYASVRFVNGVGETDNPRLIDWFRKHGYKLEESNIQFSQTLQNDQIEKNDEEVKLDFESMTPMELREWMRANGYAGKIKNTRNKEKLLEILRG